MHNVDFKSDLKPYIIFEMLPCYKQIIYKYHIYAQCILRPVIYSIFEMLPC